MITLYPDFDFASNQPIYAVSIQLESIHTSYGHTFLPRDLGDNVNSSYVKATVEGAAPIGTIPKVSTIEPIEVSLTDYISDGYQTSRIYNCYDLRAIDGNIYICHDRTETVTNHDIQNPQISTVGKWYTTTVEFYQFLVDGFPK